jgi:hypothetical protein
MTTVKVTLGPDETELLGRLAEGPLVVIDCDPVALINLSSIGLASISHSHVEISDDGMAAWERRTVSEGE